MAVNRNQGSMSVQVALVFPAFLMLVLFTFEIVRFLFIQIQLQDILDQVTWQAKIGENRDLEASMEAAAKAFGVQLVNPEQLEIKAFSSRGIAGITGSTTEGIGGPGDVVRYEMRYAHSFFGNFGERVWEPMNIGFVEFRRNEPVLR